MSAERLRQAAKVLRERAEASRSNGTEWYSVDDLGDWLIAKPEYKDAAYIATMHPGVGLALADWLDATADFHEDKPHGYDCPGCQAEAVADAILGGES